jgi:hypothetical protein
MRAAMHFSFADSCSWLFDDRPLLKCELKMSVNRASMIFSLEQNNC